MVQGSEFAYFSSCETSAGIDTPAVQEIAVAQALEEELGVRSTFDIPFDST
jgi:hypothetical protein